jgi:hypothetical protein
METILKYNETANKYGFPVPFVLLLIALGLWATFSASCSEREKYYYELLAAWGKWKNSLNDRREFYMEPGSEYRDDTIMALPGYQKYQTKGNEAFNTIRDQLPVARLFLSGKTTTLLDEMISDHWLIETMDAVCTSDYLDKTPPVVERAYEAILADAKKDLKRSRYLALLNKFLPK